jgi:diguanylate cyclase (GGDEF)-like protein
MLLDADRNRLLAKAACGLPAERVQSQSFAVGEGVAGWVVAHGEPALIADVTADPRFLVLSGQAPISSMLCVPLIARGGRVGVVTATCPTPGAFDTGDLELLQLIAGTIADDIEHIRLHRVAVTDPLTGAYNREFLIQRLPQEIETASERDRALSVALVDVDHFRMVNDRYGHGIGDIVLSEIARRLRGAIRAGDLLIRYGGEEFLAVLPRADAGRAWEVGERMRQRVSERAFDLGDGLALLVRVSVGIAQWRQSELMADLIERAGAALYGAKDRGCNRVEVSP